MKAGQFPEDASPLVHSVRQAYREINNFYTAIVYQKGAELVRMLAALVGPANYRKSTDLYLERHDGEAAVVEDWLRCFADVTSMDLGQFAQWYEQAGTPTLNLKDEFDAGDYLDLSSFSFSSADEFLNLGQQRATTLFLTLWKTILSDSWMRI